MEISALLFPVFTSYALRIHGVNARLSDLLAEETAGLSSGQLQRILAPPGQWVSLCASLLLGALMLGLGFWLLSWYWALALFAVSCAFMILTNYLIPSERTVHYQKVILRSLRKKAEAEGQGGDEDQARALEDLAERIEKLSARRNLFDEKSPTY